ncbi:MAG: hypothetical protein ABI399_11820 [Bauldia sp.]
MKKILMLGAALSLIGGVALAESSSGSTATGDTIAASGGLTQMMAESDGPQMGGKWRHGKHHGDQRAGREDRGPHHGFGPPSRGAHIVLERNGNRIDVKCAEGDSTQQCVEAVERLIDRVAAKMDHGGGQGGSPPAPEGAPAPQP